jgi:hypothetical protein
MSDFALFLAFLWKASLWTGIGPGVFLAVLVECRYHKFQNWIEEFRAAAQRVRPNGSNACNREGRSVLNPARTI